MALMVVPFEKGRSVLPRCSDGYGGRGTGLPFAPPADFILGRHLELQVQENVRLISQTLCKKHAKKGGLLR